MCEGLKYVRVNSAVTVKVAISSTKLHGV